MKGYFKESLSIVIPVYNEDEIIEDCIRDNHEYLSKYFYDFEIIIIDDGSYDQTASILKRLSEQYTSLKIKTNSVNLGIGKSLLKGLNSATKKYIIHNGADSPFNIFDIGKIMKSIDSSDILVISRSQYSGYSLYRRVVSFINISLLRIFFPLKLSDFNFVQIYNRKVFERIKPKSRSAGFLIPEILLTAYKLKFSIIEIKEKYQPRTTGTARAGKFEEVKNSFIDMVKFWLKY